MRKFYVFLYFLIFCSVYVYSQVLNNNGAAIRTTAGAYFFVNGAAQNSTGGTIQVDAVGANIGQMTITSHFTNNATAGGDGYYRVAGDWINNGTFNAGTGSVFLNGGNQNIGGSQSTTFYNLILEGTGQKIMLRDQTVSNVLNLNDRELRTDQYIMFVTNPDVNAIQRTTGFVSSLGNGSLSRATNSTGTYLFPVGSSIGTPRYRPVEITPANSTANTYTVRMANVDATSEGFDRSLLSSEICEINPNFYHRINRINGTAAATISIYYDATADGSWEGIAHWTSTQWQSISGSNSTPSVPFHVATATNWNNFSQEPYALYKAAPALQVSATQTSICQGGSTTLTVTGASTYEWSHSLGNASSVLVSPTTTTTYTVTGTTAGNCTATAEITIVVHSLPSVQLTVSNSSICEGGSTTLTASGATSYQWSHGLPAGSSHVVSPTSSTTYYVTGTDANNCSNTAEVTVTVNPNPNVTITSSNSAICEGSSTTLTATGAQTYTWSHGLGSNPVQNVSPSTSTTYTVTGTDGNNCSNTAQITITVYSLPSVQLQASQNTICIGESVTLTASGAMSYQWSHGLPAGNSHVVSPTSTTTYSVTGTDGNNCQNTAQVTVQVVTQADATITTTQTQFCTNDPSLQFTAVDPGGVWSGDGISSTGLFSPSLAGPGTHTIIYTISGSCGDADTIQVTVYAAPSVSLGPDITECQGQTVVLDAGAGYSSYNWYPSGNTQTIQVTSSGTYSVTVTNANNCSGSAQVTVTFIPQADATITTVQNEFCANDSPVQFAAAQGGGTWSGNGINASGLFNPAAAGVGTHIITYTISGQCGDTDTKVITVNPVPNLTIAFGDESCIDAADGWAAALVTGGSSPYVIVWNNGNNHDTITSLTPGTYSVTVTDTKGCGVSGQVTIQAGTEECRPPHVFVPNIFSPNGDGMNDILFVYGHGIQYLDFIIYSRWGEKLFETDDITIGWDGTYKGKQCPPGVYVYMLNVTYRNNETYEISGTITLVR